MDNSILKALWIGMYILCCVLGFVTPTDSISRVLMLVLAVAFFIPPALLLYRAKKEKDEKDLQLVRRISLISLGITTIALVANFLSVLASTQAVGTVLHYVLALVSVPMLCSQNWVVSLFLWACLLFSSLKKRRRKAK